MKYKEGVVYKKVFGALGEWYIPIPFDGERMHVKISGDSGGHSFTVHLDDGSVERVEGPWNSNVYSMIEDIGCPQIAHYTL